MEGRSFSKMKFKPEATSKLRLSDIEYPIPTDKFPMLMMSGGEVKREPNLLDDGFEPPSLNWSSAIFRKRRTENGEQTTEAGRDYHEVTAS